MRNQTWDMKGQLMKDEEFLEDSGTVKVRDHLAGSVRAATLEETAAFRWTERIRRMATLGTKLAAGPLTLAEVNELLRLERGL